MQIPIQNIYYLLCYAWNKLEESEVIDVNKVDFTQLVDLFAKILAKSSSRLLKRGLDRYYIEQENAIMGIKGKLNFSETIKQNLLPLKKTVSRYDQFDYDILHNQILKSTIGKLLRVKSMDRSIKEELHTNYLKFPPISEITIRNPMFSQIRLHRNNYHYDFILKVCKIVNENLLIDESKGEYQFKDFTRDEKAMARLFEEFIRNFYRVETDYSVSSSQIQWQLEAENSESRELLPIMKTDTTLQSRDKKIIIETKYYKEPLKSRYNTPKIDSSNLYQLFSYLKNQVEEDSPITSQCEGILLYPSTTNDFYYSFKHANHRIRVISINLNQKWQHIRSNLLDIVN